MSVQLPYVSFGVTPSLNSEQKDSVKRVTEGVKEAIRKVEWAQLVQREDLQKFVCAISLKIPHDPVFIDKCRHVFEKQTIVSWIETMGQNATCPNCRGTIDRLYEDSDLKDKLNKLSKEYVPTLAFCSTSFTHLRQGWLLQAKKCIEKGDYLDAIKAYEQAFLYASSSEDYKALPEVYGLLNETEKADCSLLYLCLYQLNELKVGEAIESLKKVRGDLFGEHGEIITLLSNISKDLKQIDWMISLAKITKDIREKRKIYRDVLTINDKRLDVYQDLINLTTNFEEKKELINRAIEMAQKLHAHEMEKVFLEKRELLSLVVNPSMWKNAKKNRLPSPPKSLVDFLNGDCTLYPGKKRLDTHIVVPIFSEVEIDGEIVPLTFAHLDRIDKQAGGPGGDVTWSKMSDIIPNEKRRFCYGVMTKDVIKETRNKTFEEQVRVLTEKQYVIPKLFDVAVALFWENMHTHRKLLSEESSTMTRCIETVDGNHIVLGNFKENGLSAIPFDNNQSYEEVGMVGFRKFN